MKNAGEAIVTVLLAIIGVAVVAILISNNAQTVNVLNAAFGGLSSLLQVVITPVTSGASQSTTTTTAPANATSNLFGNTLLGLGTGTGIGTNAG